MNYISHQKEVLPLLAEKNDESDTADPWHSTAQRCNGGQGQEVAHWARLQLLSQDTEQWAVQESIIHQNSVYVFMYFLYVSSL